MSEITIKSSKDPGRVITIAKVQDGVVIDVGDHEHPFKFTVAFHDEDFPAVFAALKRINNEILEKYTI